MGKTIVIAEKSEVIRKGLVHIIESLSLFDNIHEINSFNNLESSIIRLDPDVLIINPAILQSGTEEWLAGIRSEDIKISAIIYSLYDDEIITLFDEVIRIGDSRLKIKTKLNNLLDNTVRSKTQDKNSTSLTVREKDVIRLLAQGLSTKEISEKLFISPHTVITHRKNITRKLNIRSVAGLIVYAIINEIVTVDELHQE